jgi:hypothetical protein
MIKSCIPSSFLALVAVLALPFALTACDTVVDDQTVQANPPPTNVQEAPPALPEIEEVPLIETPQTDIWRPGYWAMIDHHFVWVQGKVIPRPSPTAVWRSAHWTQHTYGWSFEMGHWE